MDSPKGKFKNLINALFFFVFGVVCFSGWSYHIITQVIGIPYYTFEILLIPFLIYYRKRIAINYRYMSLNIKVATLMILFYILLCMLIGAIKSGGYIEAIITTSRTLFYLVIITGYFATGIRINIKSIQWICIGAILGGATYSSLYVLEEAGFSSLNIIAVALMVLIPASQANIKQMVLWTTVAAIIAFLSGFRINIVVVVFAFIVGFFNNFICRKVSLKVTLVAILFAILMGLLVSKFYTITDFLIAQFDMDVYTVYRVRDRLFAFFSLDFMASGDNVRFNLYKQIADQFLEKIIPSGLIGKAAGYYGTYFDVPIIFLYDSLGSICAWIVVLIFFYKGLKSYIHAISNRVDEWTLVCAEMIFLYPLLIVVNGRFMFIAYETMLTGVVFGNWLYNARKRHKPQRFECKLKKEV